MSVNYIDHVVDQESGIEYEIVDTAARGDISKLESDFSSLENALSTETEPSATFNYTDDLNVTDIILNGVATGLYDGMVVVDGVNVKVTSTNGQTDTCNLFMISAAQIGDKADGSYNFLCDKLPVSFGTEVLNGRAASGAIELRLLKTRCEYSVEAANAWLAQNPLRIWYETTSHASATSFYNTIKCTYTNNSFALAVGTLTPVAVLADGDTLSLATGTLHRVGGTSEQVSVSALISSIPKSTAITSDCDISAKIVDIGSSIETIINQSKREYTSGKYIAIDGMERTNAEYSITDYVFCGAESEIILKGVYTGSSSLAYAFYDENKQLISGQNSVVGNVTITEIPSGTQYARFCSRISNGETPSCFVYNTKTVESGVVALQTDVDQLQTDVDQLQTDVDGIIETQTNVKPEDTTFFEAINYFDLDKAVLYTDRFMNNALLKVTASSSVNSLEIPVEPNTEYYLYIPNANRYIVAVNANNDFSIGNDITLLVDPIVQSYPQHFTTGATTTKVAVYFYSGTYDYESNKDNIVLNIGEYTGNQTPYIPYEYLPKDISNVLDDTSVLIFGDSITDTCNFTIDSADQTSAVTWKNPSNSYVNAGGTTVQYSMWPKILKVSQPCREVRNYARSGASYRTRSRDTGEERQNLQYQIDVALNDVTNPNGVFDVNDFSPDIVIFALGTNDGTPADTFDSAMSATVYQSDGVSIDVNATLSALDDSTTIASARKAFMRIKQAFPTAQIYCVLPIQRANDDVNWGTLRTYLKQMAERYGCIIIDGTADSGITRDFNNWNALGTYLKDGLHPNEKGQNMMARMIISALKAHYIPFGYGFNS